MTTHRPGCSEPGWTAQAAHAIPGLVIARCQGCGAVELRREGPQRTAQVPTKEATP